MSMLLVCGQHKDIVKRVKLGRQQKETEYIITADIDKSNQIEIIIPNLVDNSEDRFVVKRPLVRKDISL